MGFFYHSSIIVTSFEHSHLEKAHEEAKRQFGQLVSEIIQGVANGYDSFFIAPDGSKEGWDTSDDYDERRKEYSVFLRTSNLYIDAVEVRFGEDDPFVIDI